MSSGQRLQDGQTVSVAHLLIDRVQISRLEQCAHVRVQMRWRNARRLGTIHLRAQFGLHLGEFCILRDGGGIEGKIPCRVEQAGYLVSWAYRSPAQSRPFAVEGQVNAEIGAGMLFRPARRFWEPRAGNQDAGRSNPSLFESLKGGPVDGMVHAEVVGVNHQQARRGGIAQALLDGVCLRRRFWDSSLLARLSEALQPADQEEQEEQE